MRTLPDRDPSDRDTLQTCLIGAFIGWALIFVTYRIFLFFFVGYETGDRFSEDLGWHMVIGVVIGGIVGGIVSWYRGRLSRPTRVLSSLLLIIYAVYLTNSPPRQKCLTDALCNAIDKGSLAEIRSVLDQGIDIERLYRHTADAGMYDAPGEAMHHALVRGDCAIITLLLDRGVDVDASLGAEKTALITAIEANRMDIVQLLLRQGADINLNDYDGNTPLLTAIEFLQANRLDTVQLFIKRGADVNLKAVNGKTPLQAAIEAGDLACCRLLLDHGAEVNAAPRDCNPALCWAAASQADPAIATLLLDHGADLAAHDRNGQNAVRVAIKANRLDVARLLAARGVPVQLLDVAMLGDASALERLLHRGAKIEEKDQLGSTPLLNAADANSLFVVQLLLEHGANVEATDSHGYTPLLDAAIQNNLPMVKLLLHYGADVNAKEALGKNALMLLNGPAASDPEPMIDTLIHAGIDPKAQDQNGETALDCYQYYARNSFRLKAIKALERP